MADLSNSISSTNSGVAKGTSMATAGAGAGAIAVTAGTTLPVGLQPGIQQGGVQHPIARDNARQFNDCVFINFGNQPPSGLPNGFIIIDASGQASASAEANAQASAQSTTQSTVTGQVDVQAQTKAEAEARAQAQSKTESRINKTPAGSIEGTPADMKAKAKAKAEAQAEASVSGTLTVDANGNVTGKLKVTTEAEAKAKAKAEAHSSSKNSAGKGSSVHTRIMDDNIQALRKARQDGHISQKEQSDFIHKAVLRFVLCQIADDKCVTPKERKEIAKSARRLMAALSKLFAKNDNGASLLKTLQDNQKGKGTLLESLEKAGQDNNSASSDILGGLSSQKNESANNDPLAGLDCGSDTEKTEAFLKDFETVDEKKGFWGDGHTDNNYGLSEEHTQALRDVAPKTTDKQNNKTNKNEQTPTKEPSKNSNENKAEQCSILVISNDGAISGRMVDVTVVSGEKGSDLVVLDNDGKEKTYYYQNGSYSTKPA